MTATDAARADDLIAGLWDDVLRLYPLRGTYVGDPRHDHELSDPSEDGRADTARVFRSALEELAAIDVEACPPGVRTTLEIAEAVSRTELRRLDVRMDRWDVASHISGPATTLGEVASVQVTDTPQALDAYEERLRSFPRYLAAWTDVGRDGIAAGTVAPRVVVERTLAMLERILALTPDASPATAALADARSGAHERITRASEEAVIPAYAAFHDFLRREYLPAAPAGWGLGESPQGDAMYAAAIMAATSLDLSAEDVHALGVERLAAIQEERLRIANALGYADPATAVAAWSADPAHHVSREDLLRVVEDQVARSWEAAPAFFGRLPEANCQVRLVEDFRAAESPFAFYNPPTEDGSRPGIYYVNAFGIDEHPVHHLAGITFHEANPGHHFQIALEMQTPDRPPLRRFGADLAGEAFAEGWGLYAERLADEMGLYADDWERLGMLENQGHRAARLVVDTGLHALGWDRQRAIDTLIQIGLGPLDAAIEVDRYIALPGQALCYMIGMIEIERAREVAMAVPGASLRAFHDEVLAQGQLPLPSFRRLFGLV
jgi:uncharacterized protein (DUF885 family)